MDLPCLKNSYLVVVRREASLRHMELEGSRVVGLVNTHDYSQKN